MSMSFGGDPYAALTQALRQRQQAWEQRGQRMQAQQMPQMGGTMQMQPAQFGNMGGGQGGAQNAWSGAMPSASSMAELLQRMRGTGTGSSNGNGPSMWERWQGWGPDLGSRMPEKPSGEIQTYKVGQTPIGGGY